MGFLKDSKVSLKGIFLSISFTMTNLGSYSEKRQKKIEFRVMLLTVWTVDQNILAPKSKIFNLLATT